MMRRTWAGGGAALGRSALMWGTLAVGTLLVGTLPLRSSVAAGQTVPSTGPVLDASTPKAALKSLATAMEQGDTNGIRSLFDIRTSAEEKVLAATSRFTGAMAGLNRAMVARFGRTAAKAALGTDSAEQLEQSLRNIDASVEKIDGDVASVSVAPGMSQGSMSLHKVDGTWKVQLPEAARALTDSQAEENAAMMDTQVAVLEQVAAEIQAGKYATAADAAAAAKSKIAVAQMPSPPSSTSPASPASPATQSAH